MFKQNPLIDQRLKKGQDQGETSDEHNYDDAVLEINGLPRQPKNLPGNQYLVKLRVCLPEEEIMDNPAKQRK